MGFTGFWVYGGFGLRFFCCLQDKEHVLEVCASSGHFRGWGLVLLHKGFIRALIRGLRGWYEVFGRVLEQLP